MNEQERFKIINLKIINKDVLEYLKNSFINLKIKILNKKEDNIINLMNWNLLEGWCWQTTNTAILFLNDNDYILRGNLTFSKYKTYFHSWIVFNYNNIDYVFDPCLSIICEKNDYDFVFEPDVMGMVLSKDAKKYFID